MKPRLAAAVKRAQSVAAPKRTDDEEDGFDPLEIAAREFAEATDPKARADAALALVELARHHKAD